MATDAGTKTKDERRAEFQKEWWRRTLAVFQSPRSVFAAMRDDSRLQAEARQEPVILLVLLAALAVILTTPATGTLMDDPRRDSLVVAVIVFLTAAIYGIATYWIAGAFVYVGSRGAGGEGSYRRSRHILAYAAAPLALSLFVLWPIQLAMYGTDAFRSGGDDSGTASTVFQALEVAFFVWAFALLVLGIMVVHRWSVWRSLVALALGSFAMVAIALVPFLISPAN